VTELDLTFVDRTIERIGPQRAGLIAVLQALQEHYRYLPEEALRRVCEVSEITAADIAGVSTFYDQFRHRPVGQHMIHVCVGTACHVKGAGRILERLERELDVQAGGTTDDMRFTVEAVRCLGCCGLAPVVTVNDDVYGKITSQGIVDVLDKYPA
jgi:NADH-quinone oxidoreductase subunit F